MKTSHAPRRFDSHQVGLMMIGVKMSRLAGNLGHDDSWVDIAGYVGCIDRIERREEGLE